MADNQNNNNQNSNNQSQSIRAGSGFDPEKAVGNNNGLSREQLEAIKGYDNYLKGFGSTSVRSLSKLNRELSTLRTQILNVNQELELASMAGSIDKVEEYSEQLDNLKAKEKERQERLEALTQSLKDYYGQEEYVLEQEARRLEQEEEIDKILRGLEMERRSILSSDLSRETKRAETHRLDNEAKAYENMKRRNRGERTLEEEDLYKALGGRDGAIGSLVSKIPFIGEEETDDALDEISGIVSAMFPEIGLAVEVAKSIAGTVSLIQRGLGELRNDMTQSIENAAKTMSNYYGTINANLQNSMYGDGKSVYENISNDVEEAMGLSRLVKQTEYLGKIAELSNQGLVNDIEQRALLETIKDKTLTSFDATNAGLLRLIRLGEQDTINQFGIELQLKRMLNKFGDATYLTHMFDGVTQAIIDAASLTKSDVSYFSSTVQTWLGAMYASGLSDNVVNAIAQGINALGSGNVSQLAQDESVQRLFLLSMDRIGMDYADILQQGLSQSDINSLLSSVIQYLDEIAGNTKDNLVLRSSYSNLFNMSVSDMEAIHNVSQRIGEISGSITNSAGARSLTSYAASTMVTQNTLAAEMFENLFNNFSYTFGSNVAENNGLYTTYRIADISYNLLDKFSQVGGALGKAMDLAKLVPAAVQYVIGGKSFLNMFSSVGSISNNSLLNLLQTSSTNGIYTTATASSSFKQFKQTSMDTITADSATASEWESAAEDEVLGILKEISKTLMHLKEGENEYAIAVSVEGMNNEVLKSFASIFADEDAMLATFEGDNTVLEKALFNYFDDTTSNSTSTEA